MNTVNLMKLLIIWMFLEHNIETTSEIYVLGILGTQVETMSCQLRTTAMVCYDVGSIFGDVCSHDTR